MHYEEGYTQFQWLGVSDRLTCMTTHLSLLVNSIVFSRTTCVHEAVATRRLGDAQADDLRLLPCSRVIGTFVPRQKSCLCNDNISHGLSADTCAKCSGISYVDGCIFINKCQVAQDSHSVSRLEQVCINHQNHNGGLEIKHVVTLFTISCLFFGKS